MSFFRQLKNSVTDFRFYRNIKDNAFGKSFLYFLILFLILYTINSVQNYVFINNGIDTAAYEIKEQVPDFELTNGELNFSGPMPYYFINEESAVFVVDTTGQVNLNTFQDTNSVFLVTKDSLYVKNDFQQQEFRLENFTDNFDKSDLINLLPKIKTIVLLVMVIGFIFVLAYKLLNAVLLAVVGLIFSSIFHADLKYKHVFNFAIYALTLPLLLQLAHDLSGLRIPRFGFVYWAVSILYIALAVKYYKDGLQEEEINNTETDNTL